jgi:hypothetical protein
MLLSELNKKKKSNFKTSSSVLQLSKFILMKFWIGNLYY